MEVSLLLIAFLVPLTIYKGLHNYLLIKLSLTQVLILLSLIFWLGISLRSRENFKLRRTPLDWGLVLFLFLALLSLFGSAYRWAGLPEAYRLISHLLLYGLTVNIIRDKCSLSRLIFVWLLSTGIVSLYGLYQHFWEGMIPPRSTFGNPNFFAAYLVLLFPLSLALFINNIFLGLRKNWGKILSLAILLLAMTLSLFLATSRGAWLGLAVSFILLGWLVCLQTSRRWLAKRLIPAFLVLSLILTIFLSPRLLEQEFMKEELRAGTLGLRILIWEGTARMIAAHPFLGSGIGSFRVAYPKYRLPEYFRNPHAVDATANAHNEFLQVAAETGILGLAAFLGILIVFFRKGIDLVKKEEDRDKRILILGLISGIAGLLATNLFGVNLRFPSTAIFLWLALGLVMSQFPVRNYYRIGIAKLSPLLRQVIFSLALLGVIGIGWQVVARPFLAERYFQTGINYRRAGDWEKAISKYHRALEFSPFFLEVHYRLGFAYAAIDNLDKAISTYEKLIELAPDFARVQANIAFLYKLKGEWDKAIRAYQRALELNPYDAIARYHLKKIYGL